jgi:hypothetical protein
VLVGDFVSGQAVGERKKYKRFTPCQFLENGRSERDRLPLGSQEIEKLSALVAADDRSARERFSERRANLVDSGVDADPAGRACLEILSKGDTASICGEHQNLRAV